MECLKCKYIAPTKQAYSRHITSIKHTEEKPNYRCDTCGYLAPTKQAYGRHLQVDCDKQPVDYNCIPCEYTTTSKQSYELHLLSQIHCKICMPIKIKEIPSPLYLLNKYHKSAVKMGLFYMGYRRLSTYSKFIIYKNKIISKDEYTTAYQDLENLIKQEQGYIMKYQRYAYKNDCLVEDLTYPFSM